jgi:hypothetical protein
MALDLLHMTIDRGTFNSVTGHSSPAIHRYKSSTDTAATISASGYFDAALPPTQNQLTNQAGTLEVNDLIYISASDSTAMLLVTAITPNVTTTFTAFAPFVTQFAGTFAYGGGAATFNISVPGLLATDIPVVQVRGSTNAVSVQKVLAAANNIITVLSADPGAATTLNYAAFRV